MVEFVVFISLYSTSCCYSCNLFSSLLYSTKYFYFLLLTFHCTSHLYMYISFVWFLTLDTTCGCRLVVFFSLRATWALVCWILTLHTRFVLFISHFVQTFFISSYWFLTLRKHRTFCFVDFPLLQNLFISSFSDSAYTFY